MRLGTKPQIIEFIRKHGGARPSVLTERLKISPQALHRHLRTLCEQGVLERSGKAPHTLYRLTGQPALAGAIAAQVRAIREILSVHPAICLVTLFGSQARGTARPESDIDLLVWIDESAGFSRQDLWAYWDRHSGNWAWRDRVSLVIKPLRRELTLHTLLLDFPEEHVLVFDRADWFVAIRDAVVRWRKKWGAEKLTSFGGKHGWRYTTKVKRLADIDFRLELKRVS